MPFAGARGLAREALRLPLRDEHGDPVWILYSGLPGTPFGALSNTAVGAVVHALEAGGGSRIETLPRTQQDASWNAEITLTNTLDEDGNAAVRGRLVDSTPEGLVLRLEGSFPSFVRESGGAFGARVPFLPIGLATRFGPAERHWPLALRQAYRLRSTIEIEWEEHWKIVGSPAALAEIRDGFAAELSVDDWGGQARVFTQRLEQRGLVLAADEVPSFFARLGELDKEFARPLRLEDVGSKSDR